jgi:copper homeostasis protein
MVTVEIVCCSVADALAAEQGGAHRIELCKALEVGGLTHSPGVLYTVKDRISLPIMVMVRLRSGDFYYADDELDTMARAAARYIDLGADGIVFGALNADGTVNAPACRRLREIAGERQTVFHRAFDLTTDPFAALDTLMEVGITRILTSGQQATAVEGAALIRQLRERAAGSIEILPGGSIRAHNVREILARTGCDQVHLAPMTPRPDGRGNAIEAETVAEVVRAVSESAE